jgi:O-antigen ligase
MLAGAALLFYAIAGQPDENLWLLSGLLSLIGVVLAVYFPLAHDWKAQPADVAILNRLALRWMSVRPALALPPVHQNVAGGILAVLLPFPLALALRAWAQKKLVAGLIAVAICGILAGGLLLASSRGAWLASLVALGTWFLWGISGLLAGRGRQPRRFVFTGLFLILAVSCLAFILLAPEGFSGLAGRLPGAPNSGSRFELFRSALHLVADFPFTGGGLGSFPGLYSQYIMVTPFFLFAYSHNFYLDVALEQGLFGFFALLVILGGSAWLLLRSLRRASERPERSLLAWAALASLIVAVLHGFVDDALYGERGTPLVFLNAGVAAALAFPGQLEQAGAWARPAGRRWLLAAGALVATALLVLFGWRRPLLAEWYANLGAVRMAQVELVDWPTGKWRESGEYSAIHPARQWFALSLALDPDNQTARHRLGLIALQALDFETARSHLERAYAADPDHRGLRKNLGYTYAWLDQIDTAARLLEEIPEAEYEMENYTWWWRRRGRLDLASQAKEMIAYLQSAGS